LGNPLFAAVLGFALGVGMVLVSRAVATLVTPDDPSLGFAKVAVSMVLRLALVIGALLAFSAWARSGLAPFGLALVAGFFMMMTMELFGVSRTAGR
jgi:hypothetical protein